MKITVDIPDEEYRLLKNKAETEGRSITISCCRAFGLS
jgi:hypothetical protein